MRLRWWFFPEVDSEQPSGHFPQLNFWSSVLSKFSHFCKYDTFTFECGRGLEIIDSHNPWIWIFEWAVKHCNAWCGKGSLRQLHELRWDREWLLWWQWCQRAEWKKKQPAVQITQITYHTDRRSHRSQISQMSQGKGSHQKNPKRQTSSPPPAQV